MVLDGDRGTDQWPCKIGDIVTSGAQKSALADRHFGSNVNLRDTVDVSHYTNARVVPKTEIRWHPYAGGGVDLTSGTHLCTKYTQQAAPPTM